MEFDNTNKGSLFVSDKKETEKHPDYSGSININGKDYWLSGWKRQAKESGKTYLALTIRPKDEAPRQITQPTRKIKSDDFDVPF
jgi:hypothetical protein